MIIPAKALTYGTSLSISPTSFASFKPVSAIFVIMDAINSGEFVDGETVEELEKRTIDHCSSATMAAMLNEFELGRQSTIAVVTQHVAGEVPGTLPP